MLTHSAPSYSALCAMMGDTFQTYSVTIYWPHLKGPRYHRMSTALLCWELPHLMRAKGVIVTVTPNEES